MLTRFVHSTDEGIIAGVANFLRADNSAPESSVTLLSSIINHHVAKGIYMEYSEIFWKYSTISPRIQGVLRLFKGKHVGE